MKLDGKCKNQVLVQILLGFTNFSEDLYCHLEVKGKSSTANLSLEWTRWPDVTWSDIYNYLILTPGLTHKQLKAYKSLDGYKFYVNGKVNNIIVTEVPGTNNYLYTAMVKHSYALSLPPLKVWVAVKDSGEVMCALFLHGRGGRSLCTCRSCALYGRS